MYQYRAVVTSVYDGDTITVTIDLGFGVHLAKQKIRLLGIDTPEVRGLERPAGLEIRDQVRTRILGEVVTIKTHRDKKGKYGRWLGEIFIDGAEKSLNQALIEQGFGRDY